MRLVATVLCVLMVPFAALAQPRKVEVPRSEQEIGPWLLSCAMDPMTDAQACRMRHRLWLVVGDESHPGMALEVQLRSDQLVPAVAVRDLSFGTALSGLLTLTAAAQIRFDGNPMVELPCSLEGASVICAPGKPDAAALAEQLFKARSVLVRFRAVGNLSLPLPDGPLALDLERTPEALVRFRLAGPADDSAKPWIGQNLKASVERLLGRIGVPGLEPPATIPAPHR